VQQQPDLQSSAAAQPEAAAEPAPVGEQQEAAAEAPQAPAEPQQLQQQPATAAEQSDPAALQTAQPQQPPPRKRPKKQKDAQQPRKGKPAKDGTGRVAAPAQAPGAAAEAAPAAETAWLPVVAEAEPPQQENEAAFASPEPAKPPRCAALEPVDLHQQ